MSELEPTPPPPWTRVLDESTSCYYYFNTVTGESVWETPNVLDAVLAGHEPNSAQETAESTPACAPAPADATTPSDKSTSASHDVDIDAVLDAVAADIAPEVASTEPSRPSQEDLPTKFLAHRSSMAFIDASTPSKPSAKHNALLRIAAGEATSAEHSPSAAKLSSSFHRPDPIIEESPTAASPPQHYALVHVGRSNSGPPDDGHDAAAAASGQTTPPVKVGFFKRLFGKFGRKKDASATAAAAGGKVQFGDTTPVGEPAAALLVIVCACKC